MKITGELLKSERIKLKLSQQDIAFALKLSPRTINAIEEGDLDGLPAKTFVRGFVKSYAEMLKLDPVMVLSQFQEEVGSTRPITKVVAVPSENAKAKTYNFQETTSQQNMASVTPSLKTNLNKNTLKLVALITFAVIVIGGINQVINKYQKEVSAKTEVPKLTVETLTQEAQATQEIAADTKQTEVVVALPAPINSITAPVNSVTTPAVETIPVAVAVTAAKTPEVVTSTKSIELVIEANKDTVISYSIGKDDNFKTLELKKNTFQIIKSKNGLHIKADEGNSISITVNGINKGLASSDAKPVKLSY